MTSFAQTPILAPESGNVAVIGCTDLEVQNTSVPQPNLIEWWYDDGTGPILEFVGGTSYSPINVGNYYVIFPWNGLQSNTVTAETFTPASISNSGGLLSNEFLSTYACYNPIDLQVTTNADYQYNYSLWTRDNEILESNVYDIDNVQRPGVYAISLDGPCGTENLNTTVNYQCDVSCYNNTYLNGGTITTSTSLDHYAIGGTLVIDGVTVLFTHEFLMLPGSQIRIINGGTMTLDRAIFRSCDIWKGILNDGGTITFLGSFGDNAIYDAEVAITNHNASGPMTVENIIFEDNGYHILSDNSTYGISFCEFKNVRDRTVSDPISQSILNQSPSSHPMVFANNCTISAISDCNFDQRDDNSVGTPNTITAIGLKNSQVSYVFENNIYDNFLNGIVADDCGEVIVNYLNFGSPEIKNRVSYAYNPPYSNNGLIMRNSTNVLISHTNILNSDYGIQYYNNEHDNPNTNPSRFDGITIGEASTAGIVIAPDENPLTNTDPTKNIDMTPMKVDILCNNIYGSKYGIVGSGKKTDFEGYNSVGVYNQSDPSLQLDNIDYDIVWSTLPTWDLTNKMTYYSVNNTSYPNPLVNAASGPNVILDGINAKSRNNYSLPNSPFANITQVQAEFCAPSWFLKRTSGTDNLKEETKTIKVYPNPTSGKLTIELDEIGEASVIITNGLGQVKLNEQSNSSKISLDISDLPVGVYFITVAQNGTQTIQRIIKQ